MVITMCYLLNAFYPINKRCPLQLPEKISQPLEKVELSKESGGYVFLGLLDAPGKPQGITVHFGNDTTNSFNKIHLSPFPRPHIPLYQPQVWEAPSGRSAFPPVNQANGLGVSHMLFFKVNPLWSQCSWLWRHSSLPFLAAWELVIISSGTVLSQSWTVCSLGYSVQRWWGCDLDLPDSVSR